MKTRRETRPAHPLGERTSLTQSVCIRTPMMKLCAQPAKIWSAVTCHRFCRFGDLSPKQGRVQRPGRPGRLLAFDGDKSPAESADKSAHSKVVAAPPRYQTQSNVVRPCPPVTLCRPGALVEVAEK